MLPNKKSRLTLTINEPTAEQSAAVDDSDSDDEDNYESDDEENYDSDADDDEDDSDDDEDNVVFFSVAVSQGIGIDNSPTSHYNSIPHMKRSYLVLISTETGETCGSEVVAPFNPVWNKNFIVEVRNLQSYDSLKVEVLRCQFPNVDPGSSTGYSLVGMNIIPIADLATGPDSRKQGWFRLDRVGYGGRCEIGGWIAMRIEF